MNLKDYVANIPDFPKKGILFRDISPLLANATAWKYAINVISTEVKKMNPDVIAGVESRGFILSTPLSLSLNVGSVMIRKKGKLPGDVISYDYDLEYGSDTIELKKDLIKPGSKAVIVDDLLATGGTMAASINLLKSAGVEVVGYACIIELTSLKGREKITSINDIPSFSLIKYD